MANMLDDQDNLAEAVEYHKKALMLNSSILASKQQMLSILDRITSNKGKRNKTRMP